MQVFVPSLWFNACRCKCSDLEKDFPQPGWPQLNFFLIPSGDVLELEFAAGGFDAVADRRVLAAIVKRILLGDIYAKYGIFKWHNGRCIEESERLLSCNYF